MSLLSWEILEILQNGTYHAIYCMKWVLQYLKQYNYWWIFASQPPASFAQLARRRRPVKTIRVQISEGEVSFEPNMMCHLWRKRATEKLNNTGTIPSIQRLKKRWTTELDIHWQICSSFMDLMHSIFPTFILFLDSKNSIQASSQRHFLVIWVLWIRKF